jgi:N-acetylglucosaminyldiphosphoundecaprenol N-acetyl-beta-D-mannosaminyltransferase
MGTLRSDEISAAAAAALPRPPHVEFLGLPFSLLPLQQVVRLIIRRCGAPYRYVVTPNAYHVVIIHDDPDRLLPIYRGAWLSLCDSRIVRTLARLERLSLPLVAGSDLVASLLDTLNREASEGETRHLLIVGPPLGAEAALRAAYPNLKFDVMPAAAGLAGDAALRRELAAACMTRPWDILLLCVGCPAQEMIARQIAEVGRTSGIALCAGAAIDFLIGVQRRAPLWVRRLQLEWAYRLLREPARLWRRYLVDSPKIFRIFIATRSSRRR